MDRTRFDAISRLFAERRLSRRQAMRQGAAGVAAAGFAAAGLKTAGPAAAQDGTPAAAASPAAGEDVSTPEFLFVQSFEGGSIAAKEGAAGTFTATLNHGLGQTLYFSDRPERIVGAAPTTKFLDGLGFSPNNPPNAALVVDDGSGGVNIAVVELTNPSYDEASLTATYDMSVLQDYASDVDMAFQTAPADLSALGDSLGTTHLFIDDCPDHNVGCYFSDGTLAGILYAQGFCWDWGKACCAPCSTEMEAQCNASPNCAGSCHVGGYGDEPFGCS